MSDKKLSQVPDIESLGDAKTIFPSLLIPLALPAIAGELQGAIYTIGAETFLSFLPDYLAPSRYRSLIRLDSISNEGYSLTGAPSNKTDRVFLCQIEKTDESELNTGWTNVTVNCTCLADRRNIYQGNLPVINAIGVSNSIDGGTLNENVRGSVSTVIETIDSGDEGGAGKFSFSMSMSFFIPEGLTAHKIDIVCCLDIRSAGIEI